MSALAGDSGGPDDRTVLCGATEAAVADRRSDREGQEQPKRKTVTGQRVWPSRSGGELGRANSQSVGDGPLAAEADRQPRVVPCGLRQPDLSDKNNPAGAVCPETAIL